MGEAIHVREYRDADLPAVLELLRASLGESPLLKRTPELFRWKHEINPFGRSVMLVAEIDDKIVGLRSFMRWDLVHDGDVIRCGRAVDTATHPEYLRRGIFSRLTKEALDVARDAGIQLIFNTPNDQSRPGYLKMGWSDVGPIRVHVRPHPTRLMRPQGESFPDLAELAPTATPFESDSRRVFEIAESEPARSVGDGMHTPRSNQYLKWRFAEHPTARYGAVVHSDGAVVLRANLRKGRSELVISDAFGAEPLQALRLALRNSKAQYDVAAFPTRSVQRAAVRRAGMLGVPGVTALQLVAHPLDSIGIDVFDAKSWQLALSDLELL
jgi:GNAT superfamily N-acetyltransferase